MKTTVDQKTQLTAIRFNQSVVLKRSSLPILANALIVANDGEIVITTTDLDNWMTTRRPSNVATCGAITVPTKRLVESLASCKDSVEFETVKTGDVENMAVRNGSIFSLPTLPAVEFPPCPNITPDRQFGIPAAALLFALKRVALAQSEDSTRYVLIGVCFELSKDGVRLIATDGRRVHVATVECDATLPAAAKKPVSWIVRTDTVAPLIKLLAKETADVSVMFGHTQGGGDYCHFSMTRKDGTTAILCAACVQGNYPAWRQVIPCDSLVTVNVDRAQWQAAIETAATATTEKSNSIKLTFTTGQMTVSAKSDVGEANVAVPCDYAGKGLAIAFNPLYLGEAMKSLPEREMVSANFTDELSPVTLHVPNWLCVVMPMRLA